MGLIILLLSLWKWVGFNHFIAIAVDVGWVWSFYCYRCGGGLGLVILTAIAVEVGWAWPFYCYCCGSGLGLAILLQSLWKWVGFNHFTAIAVEVGWVWSFLPQLL